MNTDSFKVEYQSNYLETKVKVFCKYCGKEIKDTGRYYDRDYYENYECNCEGAMKEIELTNEANYLITRGNNIKDYTIPLHIKRLDNKEIKQIYLKEQIAFMKEELDKLTTKL